MSLIISQNFHHLNKLLRLHSTKYALNKIRFLTTRAELTHGRPHSHPPHSINIKITKPELIHQQIEPIQCYEPTKDKKVEWPAVFIVFDLETTGFRKEKDRIVEVAFRDCSGGQNSTFTSLVNPQRDVLNYYVHGITTQMVNRPGVPTFEELVPVLLEFVKSRQVAGKPVVLIAHNGKRFDFPFLKTQMQLSGFEIPDSWLFLDSLTNLCSHIKGSKGLEALKEYYKIPTVGPAHRAMSDVNVLCNVFQRLTFDLKLTPLDLMKYTLDASMINSNSKPANS